jgi:hypothetical protein
MMTYPNPASGNQPPSIETQGPDSCPADGSTAQYQRNATNPTKVVLPAMLTRIEQLHDLSGTGVNCLGPRLLEDVAPEAAPAEISKPVAAAARSRNNVINREFVAGHLR